MWSPPQGMRRDAKPIRLLRPSLELARLDQLEAIAERIRDKDSPDAGEGFFFRDFVPCIAQRGDERRETVHAKTRMRLARRTKLRIHAEVDPDVALLEPRATALSELRRLRHFRNSKQSTVELARRLLAPGGHRELHMIDPFDRHRLLAGCVQAERRQCVLLLGKRFQERD